MLENSRYYDCLMEKGGPKVLHFMTTLCCKYVYTENIAALLNL